MATPASALHPPPSPVDLELAKTFAALKADPDRTRAFEAFARSGLPHRRLEGWRWTDVRQALSVRGAAKSAGPELNPAAGLDVSLASFFDAGETLKLDDDVPHAWSESEPAADLGAGPMATLAAGLARRTLIIDLKASPRRPVHLAFVTSGEGHFDRVRVRLGEGVAARFVETHNAARGFTNVLVEYELAPRAKLHRTLLHWGTGSATQAATALVTLDEEARLFSTALSLGAKLARIETRVAHAGAHSQAHINGVYIVRDGLHADLTSHVVHAAPGCTTRQLVKGAARKGGRGVFQGKFLVERPAQKTDAEMQHHALLLEDGAEINAKPELEIYADDVKCAHGNTAGALDEASLFYMRQRGLPESEARALLTEVFLTEAFEHVEEDRGLDQMLLGEVRRWLGAS
jgi:Fe-S cluster assembly protein SufD